MIQFAVLAHTFQTVNGPLPDKHPDTGFWKNNPADFDEDWNYRFTSLGRQFTLPVLFYISGASLALSKAPLKSTLMKIGAITLVGMAQNWVIFALGPKDPSCSFKDREKPACQTGIALDFLIAPQAGLIFPIVYQFWYTLMLMLFIAEDFIMYAQLRAAHAAQSLQVHYLVLRFLMVAAMYVYFTIGLVEWPDILFIVVCEAVVMLCLVLSMKAASKATPAAPSINGRVWQYVALFISAMQFAIPRLEVTTIDARVLVYYHFFRQLMLIGFASMLSRKTTTRAFSRIGIWVVSWILCVTASTNWFLGGMLTYPWLPHVLDRVHYLLGSVVITSSLDSVGKLLCHSGVLLECPRAASIGGLIMYLFHPPLIVLFIHIPHMTHTNLFLLIWILCTSATGLVDLASHKQQSRSLAAFAAVLLVPLILVMVIFFGTTPPFYLLANCVYAGSVLLFCFHVGFDGNFNVVKGS